MNERFRPLPDLAGAVGFLFAGLGERVAVDALVRFLPDDAGAVHKHIEENLRGLVKRLGLTEPLWGTPAQDELSLSPEDALWVDVHRLSHRYLRDRLRDPVLSASYGLLLLSTQGRTGADLLLWNATERHILEVLAIDRADGGEGLQRLVTVLEEAENHYRLATHAAYDASAENRSQLEEAMYAYHYGLLVVLMLTEGNLPFGGRDEQKPMPRQFGSAAGLIHMADDFDDPLRFDSDRNHPPE
jgi:hypothetical protein